MRNRRAGYLLDVRADILGDLNTRVVVPLMRPEDAPAPARRLNPMFEIIGILRQAEPRGPAVIS